MVLHQHHIWFRATQPTTDHGDGRRPLRHCPCGLCPTARTALRNDALSAHHPCSSSIELNPLSLSPLPSCSRGQRPRHRPHPTERGVTPPPTPRSHTPQPYPHTPHPRPSCLPTPTPPFPQTSPPLPHHLNPYAHHPPPPSPTPTPPPPPSISTLPSTHILASSATHLHDGGDALRQSPSPSRLLSSLDDASPYDLMYRGGASGRQADRHGGGGDVYGEDGPRKEKRGRMGGAWRNWSWPGGKTRRGRKRGREGANDRG